MNIRQLLTALVALVLTVSCDERATSPDGKSETAARAVVSADTIYHGGPILTMNDAEPLVEAVAVSGGSIIATGANAEVMRLRGNDTKVIDLAGRTLMPGFVDSHGHFLLTAIKNATVNMDPPPAGDVMSIADIIDNFSAVLAERPANSSAWLVGWGYDHAMLEEGRHPTRDDLDKVSTTVPILLFHFSTHLIVLNSKALEESSFVDATENPDGGIIQRRVGGQEPNGIVEETAMMPALGALIRSLGSQPDADKDASAKPIIAPSGQSEEQLMGLVEQAVDVYASQGFTTASEFGISLGQATFLQKMGDEGNLPIDIVAGIMYLGSSADEVAGIRSSTYRNHFRVAGGKINIDGGSPGRTAFLREPYYKQLPGEDNYRGYSSIKNQEDLNELVASYYAQDIPMFIHALGDAAVDQSIAAVSYAEAAHPGADRRTQLIHLQQVQDDQFDSLADLDVTLTFQVAHNFYFADFHAAEIYGPQRTAHLNPAGTAVDRGFSVTIHHDSPVHPVDQFMLIWAAVERRSRSGKIWGEDERLSVMDALKASTINAAYQFHEEDSKGSIEVNKLANLIILDQNPLETDSSKLRDLRVLETIKEGVTIWQFE
jgi:predicted amidohydrolase YtcJ